MAYLQDPRQFGELGKLKISFKHPFGKKSIFGKTVKVVGKVAKVAVPIVAGGLALKFGPKLISKAAGLFKRRPAGVPPAPSITPPAPGELPTAPATVADTAAQVGATAIMQAAGILPGATPYYAPSAAAVAAAPVAAPGAPDGAEANLPGGEEVTAPIQAGMFGGGDSTKTLLILGAVGLGAVMLSKRR